MISSSEIEAFSKQIGVTPQNVERDYIHGWLLKGIFEHPKLATTFSLKGGSAIRKGYNSDSRFSKDLDLSCSVGLDEAELIEVLKEILSATSKNTGVTFELDRTRAEEKRINISENRTIEARIYFKGFYKEETVTLKSQLDINEFEAPTLPIQRRALIHPYSDSGQCTAQISCHKLEEILASKLTTLLFRHRAQDIFDLLFSILFTNKYPISRGEIIRTFLSKSIYGAEAQHARRQLLSLPMTAFRTLWDGLVMPTVSRFNFEYVENNYRGVIESLFALLEAAPFRARPDRFRYGGNFSSDFRSLIIQAGRDLKMIEADYQGIRRLIEPYKLEYRVRKKDNLGFEYFYGFDQTGGKTGPGIKSFFSDQLQNITRTDLKFSPRYPIEL